MADSSEQGHRDLELVRVHTVRRERLGRLFEIITDIHMIRREPVHPVDLLDEELAQMERDMLAELQAGIEVHVAPIVVIGSGHSSLRHKVHALAHALRLEVDTADDSLSRFTKEVVAVTSDQGVEFGFGTLPAIPVDELFPWARRNDDAPC